MHAKGSNGSSVASPPPYDIAVEIGANQQNSADAADSAKRRSSDESAVRRTSDRLRRISKIFTTKNRSNSTVSTESASALIKQLGVKKKKQSDQHDICTFAESPKTLFRNVKANQVEAVRKVYNKVPERILCRNELGETLLHVAAAEGHLNMVHFLLDCDGVKIDDQDTTNWNTPLHCAVQRSKVSVIDYLILKGAKTDVLNKRYMAPIHLATEYNLTESLQELIKHKEVDPNLPGENDAPPLHNASANNLVECANILLENGALPNKPNASGLQSVHVAAKNGAKDVIDVLVKHAETHGIARKQIINSPDRDGNVPLHAAVDSGNVEAVRVCLEAGADIDVQQEDKSTPIHFACARKEINMVKLMFALQPERKRAVLGMRDVNGMTPLHRAVMLDHEVIVEYLLDEGANCEVPDLHGRTPLLLAAANCANRVISLLIRRNVDVFKHDEASRNFIHLAVINRMSFDDFKFGADDEFSVKMRILLNERDMYGSTPLHYASGDGLLQTIERLLLNGAEIAIRNNDRDTALHFAACQGRYNSCRRLLDSPSGPFIINVQDCNGRSALFVAAENGHSRVVDLLLLKGALFHRDNSGQTVLHAAAKNGHVQTVQLLLNTNASLINATAVCGDTALHLAAKNGHVETVLLLMSNKAEFLVNKEDKSFLHEAIFCNHEAVTKAILQHDRWEEAMDVPSDEFLRPTKYLIELMPKAALLLLDNCTLPNEKPSNDVNYEVMYDLNYIEPPRLLWSKVPAGPLPAINAMMQFGRFELLAHPCSQALLKMKWETYGRCIFFGKMGIWLLYVLMLTYFIIWSNPLCHDHLMESAMRSCCNTTGNYLSNDTVMDNSSMDTSFDPEINSCELECLARVNQLREECIIRCPFRILVLHLLFLIAILDFLHNVHCLYKTKLKFVSQLMWAPVIAVVRVLLLTFSLLFLMPVIFSTSYYIPSHWQWNMGIAAMSLSWIHLFLFLQLENTVGIYVVMFMEIMKTIIRASLIFEIMLCGFGFTFHVLLKYDVLTDPHFNNAESISTFSPKQKHGTWTAGHVALSAFKSPSLSLLKVVLMMTGELDFLDTFTMPLEDESDETLHFPTMTYVILGVFILCVPIVLMNMLLGLALGNIEAVLRNASLKKICMQVQLHTEIEKSMPIKMFKFFRQPAAYIDCPNSNLDARNIFYFKYFRSVLEKCRKRNQQENYELDEPPSTKRSISYRRKQNADRKSTAVASAKATDNSSEQNENKFTNKEICILLERQTEMLRSVMQHLHIGSADLEELEDDQLAAYLNSRQTKRSKTVFKATAAQVTTSANIVRKWVMTTRKSAINQ